MARLKVNFLFALIELFSLSITVPELWGEMCTIRLFSQGSTSSHPSFTWTWSSPNNHSFHQKTRDTGLPDIRVIWEIDVAESIFGVKFTTGRTINGFAAHAHTSSWQVTENGVTSRKWRRLGGCAELKYDVTFETRISIIVWSKLRMRSEKSPN